MNNTKEVYFAQYCLKCKYWEKDSSEDPCWFWTCQAIHKCNRGNCMNEGFNIDSHKPVKFEEK